MRPIDWSILLLGAFEIPSFLLSQYRANGVRTALAIAIFVLVYSTVRLTIRTSAQMVLLCGLLGLGGALLAFSGQPQFDENVKLLRSFGLTNLVAFRSRLISPPSPWIAGEWFTLLLIAVPFACVLPIYLLERQRKLLAGAAMLVPCLIVATLNLSLSRAISWSVVVFCVVVCGLMVTGRVVTIRAGAVLLGSMLGALILIVACESVFFPGIFTAYAGHQTSQVRSTEGRLAIWHRSFDVVRAHPLWGVGSANAALALTSTADQEETTGFASRTFSLPLQILVEKGMIGVLVYAVFLTLLAREFLLNIRSSAGRLTIAQDASIAKSSSRLIPAAVPYHSAHIATTCCFAAGLVAVLFRELFYSSLLEHVLTVVLVAVLSALICSPERGT